MRFKLDTDAGLLIQENETERLELSLYSKEAFQILSSLWLKIGWNERYHYTYTWMGKPILQLPEDLIRLQEVITSEKPDLIIETGVAFGGSLLFYATLLHTLGRGKVIGVEIDFHLPNRTFLESHPLSSLITVIEGNSVAPQTLEALQPFVQKAEKVIVILDSNHTKDHVLQELEAYCPFVSSGSYLVVGDSFKGELHDVPRGKPHWKWDHPGEAIREFLEKHTEFCIVSPERQYNRSPIRECMTHFPNGWLRRK